MPQPGAAGQLGPHPAGIPTQRVGADHPADHAGDRVQRQIGQQFVLRLLLEQPDDAEVRQPQTEADGQFDQDRPRAPGQHVMELGTDVVAESLAVLNHEMAGRQWSIAARRRRRLASTRPHGGRLGGPSAPLGEPRSGPAWPPRQRRRRRPPPVRPRRSRSAGGFSVRLSRSGSTMSASRCCQLGDAATAEIYGRLRDSRSLVNFLPTRVRAESIAAASCQVTDRAVLSASTAAPATSARPSRAAIVVSSSRRRVDPLSAICGAVPPVSGPEMSCRAGSALLAAQRQHRSPPGGELRCWS